MIACHYYIVNGDLFKEERFSIKGGDQTAIFLLRPTEPDPQTSLHRPWIRKWSNKLAIDFL